MYIQTFQRNIPSPSSGLNTVASPNATKVMGKRSAQFSVIRVAQLSFHVTVRDFRFKRMAFFY